MQMEAIFLVQSEAVSAIRNLPMTDRLDYLLDLHPRQKFKQHIIDMDVFIDIPDYFYERLTVSGISFPLFLKSRIRTIYEDSTYSICVLPLRISSVLASRLMALDNDTIPGEITKSVDRLRELMVESAAQTAHVIAVFCTE